MAAYLRQLNLSGFDPKAPPPAAFHAAVSAGRDPDVSLLADAIDELGNPHAVIVNHVAERSHQELTEIITGRANARRVPYLFEEAGYERVTNPGGKIGKWKGWPGGARRSTRGRS